MIDDEAPVGRAVRRALGRTHDVTLVTSSEDAMDLIQRAPGFDVVISV